MQTMPVQFWFFRVVVGWIFPGIFILVGISSLFTGARNFQRAQQSTNWPQADGVVQSAAMSTSRDKHSTIYRAEVSYNYVVSGVTYSGSGITFGKYGSSDSGHARSILARYPQGKKVKVFYAPDNPTLAVLETGLSGGTWLLPIFGAVFFLAGIGCLIFVQALIGKLMIQ